MNTATSPLTPLSETPYKRSRITTVDTTDPGPPTSRRRITSESAQRSLARSVSSRYERTPSVVPTRRSTRLRGGPSSLVRPLEEEGERTPRASLQRSGARYSISRSYYRPRASLLQTQATPLTIERRAGVLCDVAKAVLLEYVRFADATEKHAQRRDTSWKKLQGAHMILSDEQTPPFLDLETVIGALTTHQKQNILSGRIPSLQTGLKLSNFVGFLHIVFDPVLAASSLLHGGAHDGIGATTDVMYLAWKKFWSVVVGDDMVHEEAIELWLDYSTQIFLNSMGVPDPDLFTPSKRPAISGGKLDEVFSPSALERLTPRAVQPSGPLHSESKQALKLWKVRSASRKKLLLQGDPVELRRRFPYAQFRSEMVAYATEVLGRSRLLGMSPRELAAAIDGEDPGLLTDEEDSQAVASGLEADSSDGDAEDVVRGNSESEVTEEEQERAERDTSVHIEPDNFFDDELLREVAMELEVEARAGDSGVRDDADQDASRWGLQEDMERRDLVQNAIAGPSSANNIFPSDKRKFDSGLDEIKANPKIVARTSTFPRVTPQLVSPAENRRASNLLQRSRDVFGKALTPSRWTTTMLFGGAVSTVQGERPKQRLDSESDGISSIDGEPGRTFDDNDMLLPSILALADDASAQSTSVCSSASVVSEDGEDEFDEEEVPIPGAGVEDEGTPRAYHNGFSRLPGTLALAEDTIYYSKEQQVESAVAQEPKTGRDTAPDLDFVDNDFGDDIDYPKEPSVTGTVSGRDFEPLKVDERASQRAKKPRIPVPGDNEFADDESEASSHHSFQATSQRTTRPSGVRGSTAQMPTPLFLSPAPSGSDLQSPVSSSEDSRLHSPPPIPPRLSSSPPFRLPRDFRETAGRVTQVYAPYLGDTDPFMVDEDGTLLRPNDALRLNKLSRPKKPAYPSQFGRLPGQKHIYSRLDGTTVKWTPAKTLLLYRTIQKVSEDEPNPLQVVELLHGENGLRSTLLEAYNKQHMRDKLKEIVKSRLKNRLPVVGNARRYAQLDTRVKREWIEEDTEREKKTQDEARAKLEQVKGAHSVKEKRIKLNGEKARRRNDNSQSAADQVEVEVNELESEEEEQAMETGADSHFCDDLAQAERLPAGTRYRPVKGMPSLHNDDTDGAAPQPQPSTKRGRRAPQNAQPTAPTNGMPLRRSRRNAATVQSPELDESEQARKSSVVPETNEASSESDEDTEPATARLTTQQSKEPVPENATHTRGQTAKDTGSPPSPLHKAKVKPTQEMTPVEESDDEDRKSLESEEEMGQTQINEHVNRANAERLLGVVGDRDTVVPRLDL